MPVTAADKPAAQGEAPFIPFEFVGPNYFRTFEIPIRRGRSFVPTDTRNSSQVAIVNETLAKQLWPNEDPIGKQIKTWNSDVSTVVGIASDTRFRELKNVGPVVYFSWEQVGRPFWNGYLAVRTDRTLGTMLPSLRVAMREANPDLVLWDVQTMDQLLDAPLAQPRLSAMLMASFGLVALLLSALGLYGVMSSAVRQQTRDIGIRVALGATSRDVHRLVLTDALLILGIGALVGTGASFIVGRVLATQLFGVSPVDPVSLGFAIGALLVVGLAAAYVPAHDASRIDPLDALRGD